MKQKRAKTRQREAKQVPKKEPSGTEVERRAGVLGHLVLSASIRAAKERALSKKQLETDSDSKSFDKKVSLALCSHPRQLSFEFNLESDESQRNEFESDGEICQPLNGDSRGNTTRKRKAKVDLNNIETNLESSGECLSGWNQLWTLILDFQEPEKKRQFKTEMESPPTKAPSPNSNKENENKPSQLSLL